MNSAWRRFPQVLRPDRPRKPGENIHFGSLNALLQRDAEPLTHFKPLLCFRNSVGLWKLEKKLGTGAVGLLERVKGYGEKPEEAPFQPFIDHEVKSQCSADRTFEFQEATTRMNIWTEMVLPG
ncbi:hypothetical protein CSAL01_06916 [Colletotrichum salicis]|uniref:Uncharacterized protein n=1 Tax=Colletotrichum salicis TaxID=1209931 RepID=A0A135T9Y2_9PEZI|nr:hypothetical protein CSAL01_06916 [Colletotrichum salicis]